MFDVDCPRHGCRVLLGPRAIEAIENRRGGGILVRWRCRCGARGTLTTGVRAPQARLLESA